MPLIYIHKLSEDDAIVNTDAIFLFAENESEKGGSQLARELRGIENCVGVRIKRGPTSHPSAYYNDEDVPEVINFIDEDLDAVLSHAQDGGVVITTPTMFDDTRLEENCPEIFHYILEKLQEISRC